MTDDLWDEPMDGQFGPVFTASHESGCASCPEPILPGEDARADGEGGWIHADDQCEKWARLTDQERHPGVKMRPCSECFMIHVGECARD